MTRTRVLAVACMAAVSCVPYAQAESLPTRLGACVDTKVKSTGARLVDGSTGRPIHGSGSSVSFTNGGYQVSYDAVPAISRARRGDPVRLCLTNIPKGCPKGDDRGREYRAIDQRTHESWVLPNSEHMCGGA